MHGCSSGDFSINRGVRQGSVLSPILFLLVMDPILLDTKSKSNSLSVSGLFTGALCHADDFRSLSTNLHDCSNQISTVRDAMVSRGLTLSVPKCEAVISPTPTKDNATISSSDGFTSIPVTNAACCLGAWWTPDLSCSKWVEKNIKKARGAFFARGQGTFLGSLNPLSSRSIVETCVFPVLLYGAESWILNTTLLKKLEFFQTEIGKRVLRLPKYSSNRAVRMALLWPSMQARILCIKLSYLHKTVSGVNNINSRVFRTLAASEVESLLLVRQCRFLESLLGTKYTSLIIQSPDVTSIMIIKNEILDLDARSLFEDAASCPSLLHVRAIAVHPEGSWLKVWDIALDRGAWGTSHSLALLRLFCLKPHSNLCPVPDCEVETNDSNIFDHFLGSHTELNINIKVCTKAITEGSEILFTYGRCLHNSFKLLYPHIS